MRATAGNSRNTLLIVSLIVVYTGFVVWMYVTEPLLLLAFAAVMTLVWLRDSGRRLLRAVAPARLRNRFAP